MTFTNDQWVARQDSCAADRRDYERERLQAWVADFISEMMDSAGVSKSELASRLGVSRAHVTQALSGSRNVTLSTIADFAWALGRRAVIKFEPLRSGSFISSPVHLVGRVRPKLVQLHSSLDGLSDGSGYEIDPSPAYIGAA